MSWAMIWVRMWWSVFGGLGLSLWSEEGVSMGKRWDCGEGVSQSVVWGRGWYRSAVVRNVATGWVRFILGVGGPLDIVVCGFS